MKKQVSTFCENSCFTKNFTALEYFIR